MEKTPPKNAPVSNRFPCEKCGAELTFQPGSNFQECDYCGFRNTIARSERGPEELGYHDFVEALGDLEKQGKAAESLESKVVHCQTCGADISLAEHAAADACAYCGSNVVVRETKRLIKPRSLLPFVVDQPQAKTKFKKWISSRFFAPSNLAKQARSNAGLQGVYVPYWTYDSQTTTYYRGQRGEDYYVTESYTESVNGETVRRSRQVRKTRWYSVQGVVRRFFDDVLVLASKTLPRKYTERLEPWDLNALVAYDERYLSGFRAEKYQVPLQEGFEMAHQIMENRLREDVRCDIGGDHQRISAMDVRHCDIRFKHLLLPVWISAYRYRQKVYRFLVNGQTGEVQGERPVSWIKVSLAVLVGLAVVGAFVYTKMNH